MFAVKQVWIAIGPILDRDPKHMAKLTKTKIQASKPGALLHDAEIKGLSLRVNRDGTKIWQVRFRLPGGERPCMILGHYPNHPNDLRCPECLTREQACEQALEIKAKARRGEDPRLKPEESLVPGITFGAIAENWLREKRQRYEKAQKGGATYPEWKRQMRTYLEPAVVEGCRFWRMDVARITPRHCLQVLQPVRLRSATMAQRLKCTMSSVMEHAVRSLLVDYNPVRSVRLNYQEVSRERTLSTDEITDLWPWWNLDREIQRDNGHRYELEDLTSGAAHQLVLLTLQRPKEISHLEWSKIDFREGHVTFEPTIKVGGRLKNLVKNRHVHRVPLSPQALGVLERLRPLTGEYRWVLPSTSDPRMPAVKFHKARLRFCRAAGIEDMQLRDLRATGATILAERWEYDEHLIGVVLNHKPRTITGKVYLRHKARYFNQVREALDRLGGYIESVTSGGGEVVSMVGR